MTLTSKQRAAIDGLLAGEGQEQAAQRAGVSSRQLRRWLAENRTFQDALRAAESEALAAVIRKLIALANDAVDALSDALAGDATAAQIRAADVVLGRLLTWREVVSLEQRITALEQADK